MRALLAILALLQPFGNGNTSLVSPTTVTEVLVNQSTYLNCSTSVLSSNIQWYHYHVDGEAHEMKSVYAYGQIYEFYKEDFRIDINISNDTNSYNLLILSAKSKYAGTYLCQSTGSEDNTISLQLIVLQTPPQCQSSMKPDGIIGPNSCGMEPEELRLSCSVGYTGNNYPRLEWRTAGWNDPVQGNITERTEPNSIYKYNMTIKSDINMDGLSYVCQTTRATGTQYNCTSHVVKILYAVNASYATDKLINDEVNCSANTSSRSCRYKWMWFNETHNQTESDDWTLKIQKTGQHRCEATCEIQDKKCTVTASLVNATQTLDYTTTDSKTTDSDEASSVVPVVLMCLTAVCVCIVVILLVLWLRYRQCCCSFPEERTEAGAEETSFMACASLESRASYLGESSKRTRAQVEELRIEPTEDVPQESHSLPQESAALYDVNAKRLCMMRLEDAEETAITGMTLLNKKLFIVFEQSSEVAVYQAEVLIYVRSLVVARLQRPVDIASSSKDNCLYISSTDEILRVDGNGEIIVTWPIEDGGGTLSVTQDQTVILSVWAKSALREYSADGELIHEIGLPSDVHLLHGVKTKDHFVVSIESHMEHNIWVVDVKGSVIQTFGGILRFPKYLAVSSDGFVFVVDQGNSCVLLLSPTLECLKVLVSTKDGLICPLRIYLDEANSRIFVADVRGYDVKVLAFALQKIQRVGLPSDISYEN